MMLCIYAQSVGIMTKTKKTPLVLSDDDYAHGKHPNSLNAIKKHQFPKGLSGNPSGYKPTYANLKKELIELGELETFNYRDESLGKKRQQVLDRIWTDAIRGDMKKIQLLIWLGVFEK